MLGEVFRKRSANWGASNSASTAALVTRSLSAAKRSSSTLPELVWSSSRFTKFISEASWPERSSSASRLRPKDSRTQMCRKSLTSSPVRSLAKGLMLEKIAAKVKRVGQFQSRTLPARLGSENSAAASTKSPRAKRAFKTSCLAYRILNEVLVYPIAEPALKEEDLVPDPPPIDPPPRPLR